MKTMNDAVKQQIANLVMSLCEAEVLIAEKTQRIEELEAELSQRDAETGGGQHDFRNEA